MPPRTLHKLSLRTIETKAKPGMYCDGGGLWLQVNSKTSKSWLFRYMLNGKARMMGLGSLREVGPVKARKDAEECRELLGQRLDPIAEREKQDAQAKAEIAKAMTFKQCAERYISAKRAGWKNEKHAAQWANTLETYAYPVFGDLPVQAIDTDLVLKVLEPIWYTKTETAARVRNRIERVLGWAKAINKRTHPTAWLGWENPAIWRGHLDNHFPKRSKVQKVKHHPALPYVRIGEFMADLRKQEGIGARALELTILTVARSAETFLSVPGEFDVEAKAWTVPAGRVKNGKEHRVPLCDRAVAIVRDMLKLGEPYVFPGWKKGKPLSNSGMSSVLKRMEGYGGITVHGFRSTFRTWAAESTNFPREQAEKALSHTVGDETERAYDRGDLFEKRRKLMNAWAQFCDTQKPRGNVLNIGVAKR